MRQSSNKKGFTQIDHVSLDFVLPTLSPAAQLVYLRIYRQTQGWHQETDTISHSQFCEKTGYKKRGTIIAAIKELREKSLIIVTGENTRIKEYSINWDILSEYAWANVQQQE